MGASQDRPAIQQQNSWANFTLGLRRCSFWCVTTIAWKGAMKPRCRASKAASASMITLWGTAQTRRQCDPSGEEMALNIPLEKIQTEKIPGSARPVPGQKFQKIQASMRWWPIGKSLRCRSNERLKLSKEQWWLRCQWNDTKESMDNWLNEPVDQWMSEFVSRWMNEWKEWNEMKEMHKWSDMNWTVRASGWG